MVDWIYLPIFLFPQDGIRGALAGSTAHTLRLRRQSRGSPSTQAVTVFWFRKNRTYVQCHYAVLNSLLFW